MTTYSFLNCRLDTDARRLERDDSTVAVEPQVFDLLALFARRRGQALTKQDIFDSVWGGRIVSDDALTSRIAAARRAIGDDARRAIRTLHRVGYVFEAVIDSDAPTEAGAEADDLAAAVRFADHDGRQIAWTSMGQGPAIVIPSWWVSNVGEDAQQPRLGPFLRALGRGARLIRYDRLGTGLSDREGLSRGIDDCAGAIGAVMDAAGVERASMFASSMAGPATLRFAALHPDRVDRLCFFGSAISGADMARPDMQEAMLKLVAAHWGMGSRVLADIFVPGLGSDAVERVAELARRASTREAAVETLRLAYALDASADVPNVIAPALVLHREGDRAVPFAAGRKLAAALPNARFVALPGAVHLAWEGADDVASRANRFLRADDAG